MRNKNVEVWNLEKNELNHQLIRFTLIGIVLPFPLAMLRIAVGCILNRWYRSPTPQRNPTLCLEKCWKGGGGERESSPQNCLPCEQQTTCSVAILAGRRDHCRRLLHILPLLRTTINRHHVQAFEPISNDQAGKV
jgi:hypothetical protein